MSVDVGEGWRRLEVGERIEAGDEYLDERDGWKRVPHFCTAHAGFLLPYRRRVAAAAADAPPPETKPMSAADIQSRFLRAMFQATDDWILRGGPPPNDDTLAKIDPTLAAFVAACNQDEDDDDSPAAAPPAPHPWCRDVARDEAIRAAEDAQAVTLPDHRDLPATVALLLAEAGVAREREKELRERVAALEAAANVAPAANADADSHDIANLEYRGNSVGYWYFKTTAYKSIVRETRQRLRPQCDERMEDAAERVVRERDAAIRERDEARAECERLREQVVIRCTTASNLHGVIRERDHKIGTLEARVAELEAAPRGWLTEEDRAVLNAVALSRDYGSPDWLVITGILARSNPPKVTAPSEWAYDEHDLAWLSAIRAAGVEVVFRNESSALPTPGSDSVTPEAGTMRVPVACGIDRDGNVIVDGSRKCRWRLPWVTLDLTPAQVAEIERQVSGEAGK